MQRFCKGQGTVLSVLKVHAPVAIVQTFDSSIYGKNHYPLDRELSSAVHVLDNLSQNDKLLIIKYFSTSKLWFSFQ